MTAKAPDPERVTEILTPPTCSIPEAGYCLGIGRDSSYAAAKSGQIYTIRLGSRFRVPTAWLKRVLAAEAA